MKTSFLLSLLLTTALGARAQTPAVAPGQPLPTQQLPASKDAWGTETAPGASKDATNVNTPTNSTDATATPTDATAAPTDAATAPTDATTAPSGIESAIGTGAAPTKNVNTAVKPITSQPKLNTNSAGTYNKKVVKKQNKHSTKVITQRRRATARYADIRRNDRVKGIHRMEKGKNSTISNAR